MSVVATLNAPGMVTPVSSTENVSGSQRARRAAALAWLNEAMRTVQAVYSHINWGTEIDPALSDEFDAALEGRFWTGTLDQESFMNVWRRFYGAHL